MAKIEKSEESGPHLFFDFTWNHVPQLFLGAPWAEKMTFSQKTGHVWFGDTFFLNPWCLTVNLPYWSPLGPLSKLFCGSRPMWMVTHSYPRLPEVPRHYMSLHSVQWPMHTVPRAFMQFMNLHAGPWAGKQFHELAYSSMRFHAVPNFFFWAAHKSFAVLVTYTVYNLYTLYLINIE